MLKVVCLLAFVFGISSSQIHPRILGGTPVSNNVMYPFIVSIQHNSNHICGGSILDKKTIVTAAHCVIKRSHLTILAGTNELGSSLKGKRYNVVRVIIHPQYNPVAETGDPHEKLSDNDIALLKLSEDLQYTSDIKSVGIISQKDLDYAKKNKGHGKLVGFGETDTAIIPRFLQEINVVILTPEECGKDIPTNCHQDFNAELEICTKAVVPRSTFKGAGYLDDGGPLVLNGKLAGVILHGKHDDSDQCHKSSIELDIRKYLKFIQQNNCEIEIW